LANNNKHLIFDRSHTHMRRGFVRRLGVLYRIGTVNANYT
jgi:hypothetical protein